MTTSRICPTCKQKVEIKPGLHNAKNLFQWPSLQDWITLAILFLVLVLAYSYNAETKLCRDTLKDLNDRGLLEEAYGFNPDQGQPFEDIYYDIKTEKEEG